MFHRSPTGARCQKQAWIRDGANPDVGQTRRVKVVDWFLRDRRTGRIVIVQWPNVALGVWLAAGAAGALLDPSGGWHTALRLVATLGLGWWAVDEIARGVNPWRHLLGAVVLAGLVASLLR
jgi:hypothetical protein